MLTYTHISSDISIYIHKYLKTVPDLVSLWVTLHHQGWLVAWHTSSSSWQLVLLKVFQSSCMVKRWGALSLAAMFFISSLKLSDFLPFWTKKSWHQPTWSRFYIIIRWPQWCLEQGFGEVDLYLVEMVFSPPVRWGLDFIWVVFSFSFSSSFSSFSSSPTAMMWAQCSLPDPNRDPVSSVFRAGPQPRSFEFSVPCRTSTAIVWVQCSVPDLNRDRVSSVFRAGPQPRSGEFSVPCRTPTAIMWAQCSVPDINRDPLNSAFLAGPQPRSCEFSVPCRTSTAIVWVQCSGAGPQPRSCELSVPCRTSTACQKECKKIFQKECQKICQKEGQKICQREY